MLQFFRMRVTVIGSGSVGTVTGACLAYLAGCWRKPVMKDFFLHALSLRVTFGSESCPWRVLHILRGPARGSHAAWTARFRMRTRLYAAAAKVNIHPTRSFPRNFTLRNPPTVFIHPKISSTRFRFC